MNNESFTLAQAEAIARQYQHLVGKQLDNTRGWTIDAVAVAPADKLNQWLFAHLYMDTGSITDAMVFYRHTAFDVLLISVHNKSAEMVAFKDIRSYLAGQGETLGSKVFEMRYSLSGAASIRLVK